MRTTLTVENQVDVLLRDLAKKQNRSYKDVINEALLRGIQTLAEAAPPDVYRIEPVETGFLPGVDSGKLNQLSDDIEAGL